MYRDHLYEATKSSIEQGLLQLQQQLRKKKQIDLQAELTQNILLAQNPYQHQPQFLPLKQSYLHTPNYNHILPKTPDPYVHSILYNSGELIQPDYLNLQSIRREAQHLEYLKRLERLKGQTLANNLTNEHLKALQYQRQLMMTASPIRDLSSNLLSLANSRGYSSKKSPLKNQPPHRKLQYDQPLEEDSSALLQKYSKGIRAQEYNRDMERLVEIQKRLRKIEQQSAAKSLYGRQNESMVTPYQPKYDGNRQTDSKMQKLPLNSARQNRFTEQQFQRSMVTDQNKHSVQLYTNPTQNKGAQMFQNQKIGEVINKRNISQNQNSRPTIETKKYYALDNVEKYLKSPHQKVQLAATTDPNFTTKPLNKTKRDVSHSNRSKISPLKSERALSRRNEYQPYAKTKRPRAKSSKQSNSIKQHGSSLLAKQKNTLIPLDPGTEKVYEQILKKQINQKIQNRLQLLTCVYKDVKMRQEKNQIETLLQRFEVEAKARKEVKNIINNDPKILRKHKMVVS